MTGLLRRLRGFSDKRNELAKAQTDLSVAVNTLREIAQRSPSIEKTRALALRTLDHIGQLDSTTRVIARFGQIEPR